MIQYVSDHVGPLALNFTQKMCECSLLHCSGHGRCMPRYNNYKQYNIMCMLKCILYDVCFL